ncbi:MAG: RrF2 family transcriptional regulator [Filifactoraceae bacterium]
MKMSTKGRYGLKAISELVMQENSGIPLPIASIAERTELSELYLEQIFSKLKKAGLVESVRGAQGGYLLGRNSDTITVGEVLRVLEGSISPTVCAENSRCEKEKPCVSLFVWKKIKNSIDDVIDSITLYDIVNESKKDDNI